MTHDKFCPEGHNGQPCEDGAYCEAPCVCDELTAARADEREQISKTLIEELLSQSITPFIDDPNKLSMIMSYHNGIQFAIDTLIVKGQE